MRVRRLILFPLSLTAVLLFGTYAVDAVADDPATTAPEHHVEVLQSGLQPDVCRLESDAATDISRSWLEAASCSRKCEVRLDCPEFHPIGCSWACQNRCCVLNCE
jgi:hypothetical protein